MPANGGRKPPHDLVDIKLRCGWIVRDTESRLWRWKPWPDGESAGDIIFYQRAGERDRWLAQNKEEG